MLSRQTGVGNRRLFHRIFPSQSKVRFVASENVDDLNVAEAAGLGPQSEVARRRRDRFQPLPNPTGALPFRLNLDSILSSSDIDQITTSGKMVFHSVGDTGGINNNHWQSRVVECMESDFHRPDPSDIPSFFFHLGDIVYFKGEAENYLAQFYEAYERYPAPIMAIPGNHDGEFSGEGSLSAFVRNFCSVDPGNSPDAGNVDRDTMTQPNPFFTLDTPMATVIGLYSNVPEGGKILDDQLSWFIDRLRESPVDKALIVAVHHPLFSADKHHSGSPEMLRVFRETIAESGRVPDLVLTAHVHNYQRYTWEVEGRQVPVLVAGAGGYPNLHKMIRHEGNPIHTPFRPEGSDATLESFVDNRHGFLRIEITAGRITGKYYAVPWDENTERGERMDRFHLDTVNHRLTS